MNLFQSGEFCLHSGAHSSWKIDCDALTDDDLATLARQVGRMMHFGEVIGIPSGGLRFAKALQKYVFLTWPPLIVDDVLTTGKSMEEWRLKYPGASGVVIFARGRVPSWVTALFHSSI